MVKLRVAARVVAENDYNDVQSSPKSERKFLVVVRNPEDWLVGQLAVEVQNTYKRIYKHDLGRVKYLKDADDFDLDPEQLVADVFVNEGKAEQDGFDQEATIKVIQEQGQAVRHGSVVPDLTPVHYQKRPLPPVPRFSEVPTTLGKRNHDLANGRTTPDHRHGGKKGRLAEIDETQERHELIPSIERSPELIEDTQTSPIRIRAPNIKVESPEAQRSFRDKPEFVPAIEDELQVLAEAPPNFPKNRRNYVLGGEHVTPTSNGATKNAAYRLIAANRQSQLPITPPTDPATGGRGSRGPGVNGRSHDSKSPVTGPSSTFTKFKSAKKNLYDMPESDIEDSQMSPRAQHPLPVPKLVRRLSSIEKMPSQQQSSYDTFDTQGAWDLMDLDEEANTNEAFIAEKRHSVSMHNDFRNSAPKVNQAARSNSEDEMEIPAIASSPKQGKSSQSTHKVSQESASAGGKAKVTDSEPAKSGVPVTTVPEAGPKSAGTDLSKNKASSEDLKLTPSQKKRSKRSRKSRHQENEGATSVASHPEKTSEASKDDSVSNEASTPGGTKRDIFWEIKNRRRSSELDSPGEQLSQQLQESARKKSVSEISSRLTNAEKHDDGRPSTSGSGSATTSTPSRRSSLSKTGSSPGRLGLGITNSPRKQKQTQDIGPKEKTPEPTLVEKLRKAKEDSASQEKPKQKNRKKQEKPMDDSKAKTDPAEEAVLPSVERPVRKGGRPARLVEDLDKQCAVTKPNGSQCGRALDCDVHANAAKRAVAGRSQPFDIVLDAYKQQKRKDKPKDAAPKIPLLKLGSDDVAAAADKSPAPAEARSSQPKASSATPVLPPGMTPDEYVRMTEANKEKPFVLKRQKAGKDSMPAVPVPEPEIKVAAKEGKKPKKGKANKDAVEPSAPAPKIKVTSDAADDTSSISNTSATSEEDSDSEKEPVTEKKSESKTPSKRRTTKPEAMTKTPSHIRESTTPGSDFEAITAKLRSTPMGGSDTQANLKPPGLERARSSSDRRLSATSSDLPKSETNRTASSLASLSASKPIPAKAALAKVGKSTKQATPQTKTTPKPAVASSATSPSVNKKAVVNDITPKPTAAAVSTLKQLHQKLQQESRQASNASSPAPAAKKKVLESDSDESSSSSESSSSESESESSESAAKKAKVKSKRNAGAGAGKGGVPDPSIRDSSPDEDSGSESDED